jgi:hypothetical protein
MRPLKRSKMACVVWLGGVQCSGLGTVDQTHGSPRPSAHGWQIAQGRVFTQSGLAPRLAHHRALGLQGRIDGETDSQRSVGQNF